MKKFILAAALVAAMAPAAVAQDEFAPEKGDICVEVQFNPFSNDYKTFDQGEFGLTGRYFITNKDAIRLNIGFGVHKDINNVDAQDVNDNWVTLHHNTRKSNFNINLGYERHLVTKGRLDLYAGGQLGIGFNSFGKTDEEFESDGKTIEKTWTNSDGQNYGSTNYMFGIFTGVDFYVYKGLYVGAELGVKLAYNVGHQPKFEINGNEEKPDHEQPTAKSLDFTTYVQPALRLGWTF